VEIPSRPLLWANILPSPGMPLDSRRVPDYFMSFRCAHIPRHYMCRNIKTLFNFEPPVTDEEIRAASLQFIRKICGFTKPSQANEAAFFLAVDEIAGTSHALLSALQTSAPMKNRDVESAKARARAAQRFST
jgi:hypothetical protein